MAKEYDKISIRLSQILLKLNNGERFTIDELAEEFNVSSRTIHRDINERLSYLPLKKENGYISVEEYCLGKLSFDDIRAFATLSGIKNLYPSLSNQFLVDLLNDKVNSSYIVKGINYEETKDKNKLFETINIAILQNKQLSFTYKNKSRVINPYKLANINGSWYLLGVEKDTLKHFSISKIKNLNTTKQTFKPDKKILQHIEQNSSNWFNQNSIEVLFKIDIQKAYYFERKQLLSNQKIIEKHKDHYIISATVSFEDEMLRVAQYWLPYITILKPSYLQNKLIDILNNYTLTHPVKV